MPLVTKTIAYQDGDCTLEGFLAYDDSISGPRPTVLVYHDWTGRNEFACNRATDLAKLGYVGFALDLYGKGVLGSGPEENSKLMQPFLADRNGLLLRRVNLALETVKKEQVVDGNKIAAIGYCFGGVCVLDLARSGADIKGVVSIHGVLSPPPPGGSVSSVKAKVLVLHGRDDPMVPPKQVFEFEAEMTQRSVDWQLHSYGNTSHAFTNPGANDSTLGVKYNPVADRRSWQSMKNFLEEILQ